MFRNWLTFLSDQYTLDSTLSDIVKMVTERSIFDAEAVEGSMMLVIEKFIQAHVGPSEQFSKALQGPSQAFTGIPAKKKKASADEPSPSNQDAMYDSD